MQKKFRIAAVLVLTILLSGCHLPFSKKEFTLPYFEKDPGTVMSLSAGAFDNAKSFNFESDFAISGKMDAGGIGRNENAKKFLSFLSGPIIAMLPGTADRTARVLGIEGVFEDGSAKKIAQAGTDIGGYAPSYGQEQRKFPFFKSNAIKFDLDITATGSVDNADMNNPKSETSLKLALGSPIDFDFNAAAKLIGKESYLRIGRIEELAQYEDMLGGRLTDVWWKFNQDELDKKMSELESDGTVPDDIKKQIPDFGEAKKKSEEMKAEIKRLASAHKLIKVEERFADEKIETIDCYHYRLGLNKENIEPLIIGIMDFLKKDFEGSEAENFAKISGSEEAKKIISSLKDAITKFSGEVWIGKKDFFPRKSSMDIDFDFSKIKFSGGEGSAPGVPIILTVSNRTLFRNFNQPADIQTPQDSKSAIEGIERYIIKPLLEAPVKSRDARRISDISQIQSALELYYNDFGSYPLKLDELTGSATGTVYFRKIPENPAPGGLPYGYAQKDNGKDYLLTYMLEAGEYDLPGGTTLCATMEGRNQSCTASSTDPAALDTDSDGLTDEAEKKYSTDPLDPDTDKDGFLDGAEVKNGYNPRGSGKL
jgi:hypothetical protein